MKRLFLSTAFLITIKLLTAQFYGFVWVLPHEYDATQAMVMSENEFPFEQFHIKFNEKGEITDSTHYPQYQQYFVSGTVMVDTIQNISASLVGMFTLCSECNYFIVYKKTSDDHSEAYFVWDSWSFDGNNEQAHKEFGKRLRKKVYKQKDFFNDAVGKFVPGHINGNKIYFSKR